MLKNSWWVLLFVGLAYALYSHGMSKKGETLAALQKRQAQLEQEKQIALEAQEELSLQIRSQNDPAWIQMVLMKEMGVVPEGQRKVLFEKHDQSK